MADKEEYPRVVQVPVQHELMVEVSEGNVQDIHGTLTEILKKLERIEKAVA